MGNAVDPISVLIVDDQKLLRESLAVIVDSDPALKVVGQASNGHEAVELAKQLLPDVVLMDIRMVGGDGIAATQEIVALPQLADCKIIALTMFDIDEYVYGALKAGASGFLLKDTSPAQLISAIKSAHQGEAMVAPTVLRRLIEHYVAHPEPQMLRCTRGLPRPQNKGGQQELTPRELEVLSLVGAGLSNYEISAKLFISIKTVKTHIGNLLAKLNARDRAQLVIAAYERGLV